MNQKSSELYKKTAEITGLTEKQVEAVVEEFWYSIRNQIAKTEGNNILVHYLGNFEIPKGAVNKYIEVLEVSNRNGNILKRKYDRGMANLLRIKEKQNEP